MGFTLQLFGLQAREYQEIVRLAEDVGFEGVFFGDHTVVPASFAEHYPYSDTGKPAFDSSTPMIDIVALLSYLAASTERIRLGTAVYVLPMRHPVYVARSFASVQELSAGRLLLGLGVGWMQEEFEVVDQVFENRGSRMDEALEILGKLWDGGPVEHHGCWYEFSPIEFAAPTVQIPLLFGGHGDKMLQRAITRGQGWIGPDCSLEESIEYKKRIDRHREILGAEDKSFDYYVRFTGPITRENVSQYEEAGFEHLVFSAFNHLPPHSSQRDYLTVVERFAQDIGLG